MKQKLLFLFFLVNSLVLFANPEFQQNGYRWRNDNGSQTTATWKAAPNTPFIVNSVGEQLRLRIEVEETVYGSDVFSPIPLAYRKNGGSWVTVSNNTSTDFYFVNSTYVEDGFSTTQQISSGSYTPGVFKSNSSNSTFTLSNRNTTEIEYCIAPSTLYDKTATYEFQISNLDDYAIYPTLNANPNFCETATPTVSNITYNLNQAASPLTATGSSLLWYTSFNGGTGTATAPTPTTSSVGITRYWVTQTLNGCESARSGIQVTIIGPATHLNFDGANDHVILSNNVNNTLSGGTAITIEYWFKGTNVQSAVRFQTHGAFNDFITAGWGSGNPQFLVSTDGYNTGVELGDESIIEDNTWHHVACVWKKNEIFATYLDGVLQNSRVAANVNLPLLPENSGYLGIFGGTIEQLNGNLDDVRIWNVARTAEQIYGSKNCELQGTETGLVAYYKFNQGLYASDNTTETTLTDATSNGNNGTLTNFGLTGITSNWTASSPVSTGSIIPSAPTVTTPVTYTQGDTASPLTATTGSNGTGLMWYTTTTGGMGDVNAPTPDTSTVGSTSYWVASTNDNGCESERTEIVVNVITPATHLNFDGVNDFVQLPNESSFDFLGNEMTVEFWMKSDVANPEQWDALITKGDDSWRIHLNNSGTINCTFNGTTGGLNSTISVTDGNWHHISVTLGGNMLSLYIDGSLDTNTSFSGTLNNSSFPVAIGENLQQTGRFFTGDIDDVRFWNVARTASQINASKDCELQGTETGLVAYYKFNQGLDAVNNTSETSLIDEVGTNNGTLTNFTLTGATSNWLAGSPVALLPSVATVSTPVTYNQNDTASPLTATTGANGTGLLWHTTATGGTSSTTAPTPDTAIGGSTSYWVSSTNANGCESERTEIVVTVVLPATHLNLGAATDYVDCGNDLSLQITGNTITLEAYVKFNTFASDPFLGNIINKNSNTASGYMLRAGGNGVVNFIVANNSFYEIFSPENSISLNTWHHIAGVYDGVNSKIYVDGVEVVSQPLSVTIGNANTNLNIGRDPDATNRYLDASLDDVRIWDVARTAEQINGSKDCELQGTEFGLAAYYKFNQGVDAGTNTSVTTLTDATANANDGTLTNFDLSGTISNWLAGSPVTTGSIIPSEATVSTPVVYNQGDTATPLTATTGANGTGLLWYTTETGGIASTTAPTPDTSTLGSTSYWVSSANTNGCESERIEIVVTVEETLGVEDNGLLNAIRVYPNPTKGLLNITNTLETELQLNVYDINGRLLMRKNCEQTSNTIDISSFSNGVYIIKIKTEIGEISKRVIKF